MGARKTKTDKLAQDEDPSGDTQPKTSSEAMREPLMIAYAEVGPEGTAADSGPAGGGIEGDDEVVAQGDLGCTCAAEGFEESCAGPAGLAEVCCREERQGGDVAADVAGGLSLSHDDSEVDEVGHADVGDIGGDDAVAQAQESLGACWHEGGRAVFTCPQDEDDDLDEDGDLGRFDIHDPHQLGELGEHIAARYLRMYDYKILERNYRCGQGEADIICTKDDSVILVEVKTRLGGEARPEEAVDASKLRRYKRITLQYLMSHEWFESVRLDVVAVNIVEEHRAQVHHFMGVCAWEG